MTHNNNNRTLKSQYPIKGSHLLCLVLLILSTFADQFLTLEKPSDQLLQTTTLHPKRFLKFDCSAFFTPIADTLYGPKGLESKKVFSDTFDSSLVFSQYESWASFSKPGAFENLCSALPQTPNTLAGPTRLLQINFKHIKNI